MKKFEFESYDQVLLKINNLEYQSDIVKLTFKYLVELINWLKENNENKLSDIIVEILPKVLWNNLSIDRFSKEITLYDNDKEVDVANEESLKETFKELKKIYEKSRIRR